MAGHGPCARHANGRSGKTVVCPRSRRDKTDAPILLQPSAYVQQQRNDDDRAAQRGGRNSAPLPRLSRATALVRVARQRWAAKSLIANEPVAFAPLTNRLAKLAFGNHGTLDCAVAEIRNQGGSNA